MKTIYDDLEKQSFKEFCFLGLIAGLFLVAYAVFCWLLW